MDIAGYLSSVSDGENTYETYVITPHLNQEYMSAGVCPAVKMLAVDRDDEEGCIGKLFREYGFNIFVQVGGGIMSYLRNLADEYNAKIVHAHHTVPELELCRIFQAKADASRHNMLSRLSWILFRQFKYGILGAARKRAGKFYGTIYGYSDAFTVLCEGYRDEYVRWLGLDPDNNRIRVINNPEYTVADVCYEKKNTILYVGRLSRFYKRVDRLLKIWKKVQDRLPEYDLKIVGDGEDRDNLRQLAAKLKLRRISFEGFRTDVGRYYREASILCLVSSLEGWGLCLTEAQANGVIPVAYGCSAGVAEVLSPSGENGFIVSPFHEKEFIRTLLEVASLPEEDKMRLRRNAVNKSKTYSPERICRQWKDLFDSLI